MLESARILRKLLNIKGRLFIHFSAIPVGGEEERRRAHLLAMEIEKNEESKRNARMENMDEERDIVTHRKSDKKSQVRTPKRQSEVNKKR